MIDMRPPGIEPGSPSWQPGILAILQIFKNIENFYTKSAFFADRIFKYFKKLKFNDLSQIMKKYVF